MNKTTKDNISVNKHSIRLIVFLPSLIIVGGCAIVGLIKSELMVDVFSSVFDYSLDNLGWLYQLSILAAFIIVVALTFTKKGSIRIGGENAKPQYSFMSWFAMTVTGGIATGIITYGVSEPIVLLESLFGELSGFGIEPGSTEATVFSLARIFHDWTFLPYAAFSLCGISAAYMCYNKNHPLSVSSSLVPLLGDRICRGKYAQIIDFFSVTALTLGLAGSLGGGIILISSGMNVNYGIEASNLGMLAIALMFTVIYMFSALRGVKKGIRIFANINTYVFYALLIAIFIGGSTIGILNDITTSIGYWVQNLALWSFDTGIIGSEALVKWWTFTNWAFFIAFAPVTGIFLANISYGRTVREFMLVNWILPSVFSMLWFGIWGSTAMHWQINGTADFVSVIGESGVISALWVFLQNLPLAQLIIPIVMITLILSFSTAADSNITTISSLCVKNAKFGEEAPGIIKIVWGLACASIAYFMVAFANGEQGVEAIKIIGSVGGLFMLAVFILQIISCAKMFFLDKS